MKKLKKYVWIMDKFSNILFILFLYSVLGVLFGYHFYLLVALGCFFGLIILSIVFSAINMGEITIFKKKISFRGYMFDKYSEWRPRALKRKTFSGKVACAVIDFF